MTGRKVWHAGNYARLAAQVRRAAYASPSTRCGQLPDGSIHREGCGLTLAQLNSPWQAGHVVDGQIVHVVTQLMPQHERCNASAGAVRGNRMRTQGTTRQW